MVLFSWANNARYASAQVTLSNLCVSVLSFSQGIMLVYDITNEKSFDNIKNWIRNIEEVRNRPNAWSFHFIYSEIHFPSVCFISMHHQMWSGWYWVTNVTWMIRGKFQKKEGKRYVSLKKYFSNDWKSILWSKSWSGNKPEQASM